jgi:hypothetical protein
VARLNRVVTESPGTRDRLLGIGDDPIPPTTDLVSKYSEAGDGAATDRTFDDHAARGALRVGDRPWFSMMKRPSGMRTSRAEW